MQLKYKEIVATTMMVRDLPLPGAGRSGEDSPWGSFVMIMAIIVLCCVAQNLESLVFETVALFARMETDAAILALSIFTFIGFRFWSAARAVSMRAESQ